MFIVIEGADGVGKATQAAMVAAKFNRMGRQAEVFSFPRYKTPVGEMILRHLKGEIAIHQSLASHRVAALDTLAHLVECFEDALAFQCMMIADKYAGALDINRALKQGVVAVADRWWPSAYAYGRADGLDTKWLLNVHAQLPQADLYILLDLDPKVAQERRPELRDRYEKDRNKQAKVRSCYRDLWNEEKLGNEKRWIMLDSSVTKEEINVEIFSRIAALSVMT